MRAFVPELKKLPRRRVLTVTSIGLPGKVAQRCVNALFGTAYGTTFKTLGVKQKLVIGPLSCRWMNALHAPASKWEARWGLQVPAFVTQRDLLQADPLTQVKVADWDYDLVAQILHKGPYAEEWPSIERLHLFVAEQGYRIVGPHEEEYLTRPDAKVPKTIIRYRVKKKAASRRASTPAKPAAPLAITPAKPAAQRASAPAKPAARRAVGGAKAVRKRASTRKRVSARA
jgi:hypothetical protein